MEERRSHDLRTPSGGAAWKNAPLTPYQEEGIDGSVGHITFT